MRALSRILLAVATVLVLAAGTGIALTWAPDQPVTALTARWAKPPSRFIEIDGQPVHFRDEGPHDDPIPVVLIHGMSASLHTWEGWVTALKARHRVITMDLPGCGLTGPGRTGDYSIANDTRFTLRLLDALGVQRFVVGGNSLGGDVAWHVALAAPDRVDRLILVDAAGYDLVSTSVPIGFRMARTPSLSWLFERILPRSVVESSVRNVYGDPSRVTPEVVDRYYELTLRAGNRASLGARFAQGPPGTDAHLIRTLKLPTLILWGARDGLIPPEHARQFERDITGSRMLMYDGLGHVPHEEDPARTVADVQRFLAR
jgi:pimeloyl-ACP methyl ester carboxylesterase